MTVLPVVISVLGLMSYTAWRKAEEQQRIAQKERDEAAHQRDKPAKPRPKPTDRRSLPKSKGILPSSNEIKPNMPRPKRTARGRSPIRIETRPRSRNGSRGRLSTSLESGWPPRPGATAKLARHSNSSTAPPGKSPRMGGVGTSEAGNGTTLRVCVLAVSSISEGTRTGSTAWRSARTADGSRQAAGTATCDSGIRRRVG